MLGMACKIRSHELQKKFPENKDLNKAVFDNVIKDCEALRYIKV